MKLQLLLLGMLCALIPSANAQTGIGIILSPSQTISPLFNLGHKSQIDLSALLMINQIEINHGADNKLLQDCAGYLKRSVTKAVQEIILYDKALTLSPSETEAISHITMNYKGGLSLIPNGTYHMAGHTFEEVSLVDEYTNKTLINFGMIRGQKNYSIYYMSLIVDQEVKTYFPKPGDF